MRTRLAAIHRIRFAHALLHEGVAGLAHHRLAAVRPHDIFRIPDQARLVEDACSGVPGQKIRGQQPDDVITLDEAALLVEEETAVEVAVEGNAEIGALAPHGGTCDFTILLDHRVRHAMGKIAVRLVVDLREPVRQPGLDQVDRAAGAAIAGVRDNRQRLQLRAIHITEQMRSPAGRDVECRDRTAGRGLVEFPCLGQQANVL